MATTQNSKDKNKQTTIIKSIYCTCRYSTPNEKTRSLG